MKKILNILFCPGCDHGVAVKISCLLNFFGRNEPSRKTICSTSIGCSVFLYDFLDIDCIEAPHGRACASATGVKRANPDKFVFTYQGDGDFASIGLAESMHTALRGEKVSAICINNTTYGMTGGQMGPNATIMGQITTTSPTGRNIDYNGYPIKIAEHIALCDGTALFCTCCFRYHSSILIRQNKLLKRLFEVQEQGLGFGFVEILSSMSYKLAYVTGRSTYQRVKEEMIPVFPLGYLRMCLQEAK